MSLLSSASVWEPNTVPTKKRVSTMKNIIQNAASSKPFVPASSFGEYSNYSAEEGAFPQYPILAKNSAPPPNGTMLEEFATNENNSAYVTSLIDKFTMDNDGNNLADFKPLDPAALTANSREKTPVYSSTLAAASTKPVQEPLMRQYISSNNINNSPETSARFSNYRQAYTIPASSYARELPSYAKSLKGEDDRLMEKINYMIHLLEEQRMEKTNHIMEEFVLYALLGVFMIYIVDGFSRVGKYRR